MNHRHPARRSIIRSIFFIAPIGMTAVLMTVGCDQSPPSPTADRGPVDVESAPEKPTSSVTASGDLIRLRDASIDAGLANVLTTSGRDPSTQIVEVKGGGLGLIDFDQDGDLDVASCGYESKLLRWYENDGKGNFKIHTLDDDQESYDLRTVDMDGDGDMDLLNAGRGSKNVAWYENPLK